MELPPSCGIVLGPLPDSSTSRKGRVQTANVGGAVRRDLCKTLEDDGFQFRGHFPAMGDQRRRRLIQVGGEYLYA
jgi:hypothetical protein